MQQRMYECPAGEHRLRRLEDRKELSQPENARDRHRQEYRHYYSLEILSCYPPCRIGFYRESSSNNGELCEKQPNVKEMV